mmetsp:Transcript_20482/g.29719  ORF Transcript_20482/g.29719 Transcript_20482/m.29719 type:complete len:187 (-) Transcript_20482:171-731(-)
MSPSVLIPIADGSEEVEAVSTGNALRRGECEVTLASVSNDKTVTCARKTKVVCDALLEEVAGNKFDFIALPGGVAGANNLANSKTLIKMLKDQQAREAWYGGICAAPAVVFKPNDLFPISGTCYPSFQDKIEGAKNVDDRVVVDEAAKVITSQGPATAIPFGIKILEVLSGPEKASAVKSEMLVPE